MMALLWPLAVQSQQKQLSNGNSQTAVKPVATVEPVKEPAGDVPFVMTVKITGKRVGRDFFMPLVMDKVRHGISAKRGAEYFIEKNVLAPKYVRAGRTRYALLRVKIYGRGYRSVRKAVVVFIKNYQLEDMPDSDRLFVSNSPEKIIKPGLLLEGSIDRHESIRYLLHHVNGTKSSLTFAFRLKNPGAVPISLLIVEGDPKKGTQELNVGHDSAYDFVMKSLNSLGRIVEIPPGGELAIHMVRLAPGEIVSGLGEIRLLAGDRADFVVTAGDPYGSKIANAGMVNPRELRRGHGAFGPPYVSINDRFEIGGRWTFVGIGDKPLKNLADGKTDLMGNYGVTHKVNVTVFNPSETNEKCEVQFAPVSGPARGTLIIDGEIVKLSVVKPPKKETIKTIWLKPGEERPVKIEMIPESGSFYPVRIVFSARRIL